MFRVIPTAIPAIAAPVAHIAKSMFLKNLPSTSSKEISSLLLNSTNVA